MQQDCSVQSTTSISLLCPQHCSMQHCRMQHAHKPTNKGPRIWRLWSVEQCQYCYRAHGHVGARCARASCYVDRLVPRLAQPLGWILDMVAIETLRGGWSLRLEIPVHTVNVPMQIENISTLTIETTFQTSSIIHSYILFTLLWLELSH